MKQTTVYILLLLLTACQSKDRLDMALEYAGDNRKELEKVLEHYRGDEMKYRAARLLIENMVGHTGHDSTDVRKFQPFYDRHVAISKKYNWERPAEWQQEIDSIWKESGQSLFFPKSRKDVQTMRADRLIQEIDRSFKAWQENAYTATRLSRISAVTSCPTAMPRVFASTTAATCSTKARPFIQRCRQGLQAGDRLAARTIVGPDAQQLGGCFHAHLQCRHLRICETGIVRRQGLVQLFTAIRLGYGHGHRFRTEWGNRSGGIAGTA